MSKHFFSIFLLFLGLGAKLLFGNSLATPLDTVDLREIKQTAVAPEELLFDIVWGGWGFRWVHAGQATLDIVPTSNPKVLKIQSLAWCNPFFQSIYPVKDTVVSFINARGMYPLLFQKVLNEGSYKAKIYGEYDQKNHRLKTLDTLLTIDPFTHDVLSAFYFIRAQTLVVGKSFDLAAVSGKKKYLLRVICHREETIVVPAGKFPCIMVEPILKEDGLFRAKGKLWIWLSRDKFQRPIKMQSKIPVGSIKAELVKIGKHP